MAKAKTKEEPQEREQFFRIVEHLQKDNEHYRGYQGEVIEIEGDRVISRRLIDRPNMFEFAQTHVVDLMDPRNHVKPEIL